MGELPVAIGLSVVACVEEVCSGASEQAVAKQDIMITTNSFLMFIRFIPRDDLIGVLDTCSQQDHAVRIPGRCIPDDVHATICRFDPLFDNVGSIKKTVVIFIYITLTGWWWVTDSVSSL